ncbi:GrpE nucleotide exchange factor [Caulochytrium protostelioides]|uniref:GrpE protein homolog n=1 Tax=Caulochytrium protostelioides TaxID=1555241 RepID=A0A4V1ITJ0_9FUNG|nr:GrpE nucleotide exchange factor [Caulochytrium protostelioides]
MGAARLYRAEHHAASDAKTDTKPEGQAPPASETDEALAAAAKASTELLGKLDKAETKVVELTDNLRRALAEQENIRARHRKELADAKVYAISKFASDLLDTADVLSMALNAVPQPALAADKGEANKDLRDFYTGVEMTRKNLLKAMNRHGIDMFDPINEPFDPNYHQALFHTAMPDKEAGTIFAVMKQGYKFKDRVLRPAQVGVVKDPDA